MTNEYAPGEKDLKVVSYFVEGSRDVLAKMPGLDTRDMCSIVGDFDLSWYLDVGIVDLVTVKVDQRHSR